METRRRRREGDPVRRRTSPPRRVRGRPHHQKIHREEATPVTPPAPPPPPLSPTPPLPSPPTSPEQRRSPEQSPVVSGGETQAPQAPISSQDWTRLISSIDDIRQRNDYLQEQLEYYRHEQQDEGEREAEAVAEFEPFSAAIREVVIQII
ncbi:pectinesterase inhibitor 10-like [Lotus japonicus]|uniref:pectinesterase inhibitor 10-like n=1 Tax=Lotus japonicus TaxID=34305 RepID=UPI002590914E|nr:pectinesterase inhibitor 10-like [Lotus japonicus]